MSNGTHPLPQVVLTFTLRRILPSAFCLLFLLITHHSSFITVAAQSSTATLSGTVTDPNGAVVPDVKVTVTDPATRLQRTAMTNDSGQFVVPLLPPSTYDLTLERAGFMTAAINDVVLNVNDNRALGIQMKVGNVNETVNVTGEASLIDESPAVGTVVDRQFVENLPLNGRSFQSLMTLTPGIVLTKSNLTEQGQFSVNGQRANANYFTIDGVGANIGVGISFAPGQASAGSVPGFSATGGTNNLVSVDALQEFKVQTSTYAPEFGRQPGGQVSIVTRSGTSDFHGSLFEYFRNDVFDAADWFVNRSGATKPPLRQNIFGGVLGGPILIPRFGEGGRQPWYSGRNRSFFFFSYEGQRVRQPIFRTTGVPSLAVRQAASPQLKPFLNAFPLPNGPLLTNGFATFTAGFSIPTTSDATSIRIDHSITDKVSVFGRYNQSPSSIVQRGISTSLNTVNPTTFKTRTLTLGSTHWLTEKTSNDLRINLSWNKAAGSFFLDTFGGAIVPPDSLFLPSFVSSETAAFRFEMLGTLGAWQVGPNVGSEQRQFNLVDNVSIVTSSHQIKFGVDYRRLSPIFRARSYIQTVNFFSGPNQVLTGIPTSIGIQAQDPATTIVTNLSTYAQDTWKINRQLTLTYGARYEINPAPSGTDGKDPMALTDANDFLNLAFSPRGTALYATTYNNIAPRIGIAYQLSQRPGRETVLRGGFGVFYDLGGGAVVNAFSSGYPFTASRTITGVAFPLVSPANALPPTLPPALPANRLFAVDPNLKLPYTYQWNVSAEQSVGPNQTFTVTYVGAAGRRLLRGEAVTGGAVFVLNPALFTSTATIFITRNAATSDYRALQLQFQRRLSKSLPLQILASYSWARSVDTASNDSATFTPVRQVDPQFDRGPSDFDVRHAFSGAISFDVPSPGKSPIAHALLGNWSIDSNFVARTATPVDVFVQRIVGAGFFNFRPNLVDGVPLYLESANFPGGKRINPAAFSPPTQLAPGTLTRNALRGFPVYQIDLTVRRKFNLTERINLQFRTDFFNVLNHPNFGDPSGSLGTFTAGVPFTPSATFGLSSNTFARSLGAGGTLGGFNPVYQIGGPRSIQFSLRLGF
jgi:hypothetical protein